MDKVLPARQLLRNDRELPIWMKFSTESVLPKRI
jgi:hypothetical protein